jgi:hypothetical protein
VNCGNGIVEGTEQCDEVSTGCCVNCHYASYGATCPTGANQCVNYVCVGTTNACGVNFVGTGCTLAGFSGNPCQQPQCFNASCTVQNLPASTWCNDSSHLCYINVRPLLPPAITSPSGIHRSC